MIAMMLTSCLVGTVLVERLELKWLILVLRCVTVVRGIRDGSVEDILPCQMALFCVKCALRNTLTAVISQPSSVFVTAMDFTFIIYPLPFRIIMIIIMIIIIFIIITIIILTIIIIVCSATAQAMGLNHKQLRLQV